MKHIYLSICFLGAVILGSVLGSIALAFNFSTLQFHDGELLRQVSFNEFVGILLSCIALIMTLFGIFLAVLSVYGFAAIQEKVRAAAQEEAKITVTASLTPDGTLYALTERTVQRMMYGEVGIAESSGSLDPDEEI